MGGASGVGKSQVSYRLARHFDVGLPEVDDFQVIPTAMTSPVDCPEFHFWRLQPEVASRMDEEEHRPSDGATRGGWRRRSSWRSPTTSKIALLFC